jgi:AcrR family transcriptional regulator
MGYACFRLLGIERTGAIAMNQHQALVFERKIPKQARAHNTREVIFEATARIIERQSALNTNAIAALAGISIGTLYGHFASKEAVLVAMARRQLAHDETAVVQAVCKDVRLGTSHVRLAVHTLVALHHVRPAVRRIVMATHDAHGLSAERAIAVRRAVQRIAAWRAQAGRPYAPKATMFVAARALVGTMRAAFEEASPFLGTKEFEDTLTNLIEHCFVREALSHTLPG